MKKHKWRRFMRGKRKTMTRHIRAFIAVSAMFAVTFLPTAVYAFNWYGGASVGKNSYEVTGGDYFPFQTFSGGADGNDTAWKAFIGMQLFEKYVSAEFGYNYLGKASAKGTISGADPRRARNSAPWWKPCFRWST